MAFDITPPGLCKYRTIDAKGQYIDTIKNNIVFLARASSFEEDLWDCGVPIVRLAQSTPDKQEAYLRELALRHPEDISDIEALIKTRLSELPKDPELQHQADIAFARNRRQDWWVYSMADSPFLPDLWDKHGGKLSGYCIEYDIEALSRAIGEIGEEFGLKMFLQQVEYVDALPEPDLLRLSDSDYEKFFTIKLKDP